jgi:hypothetical protein
MNFWDFSNLWYGPNGVNRVRSNQPFHHDASGGLTVAVVAGERRR